MNRSLYGERDYAFGQRILTLRTQISLTQTALAERLGVSRKAVASWEGGTSYPTSQHLQDFIELTVRASAFPPGHEVEEIRALWHAAHQKVLLDEAWLASVLGPARPALTLLHTEPQERLQAGVPSSAQAASEPLLDWEEALDVPTFYGRETELATLVRWVVEERCRMVSVLGLGGIGKSALVVRAMRELAGRFEVVIFRSLRDAPSCEALLESCLQVLSPEALIRVPQVFSARLRLLLEELRSRRVLLVFDNVESLLEAGKVKGGLRPGFEAYGQLLQQVAQTAHQSCLLLTSREKPAALRALEGSRSLVRSLRLSGLEEAACAQLLSEHEITGSSEEQARLREIYAGNPLALKVVAETIADLFGGVIEPFLRGGAIIFGSITELLEEQWARLSPLEQTVLVWLAILREPVSLADLLTTLAARLEHRQIFEAVDGLRRRSLIERGQRADSFTLQSVVLEYVTGRLIATASEEIQQGRLSLLIQHGLCQAQAREYVRQTQERLLLAPLLARIESAYQGSADVESELCSLLHQLRGWPQQSQGYGPANLVALLRMSRRDLRKLDLSYLTLRGAYLQNVEMQDTNLSGALMRECAFTETFDAITTVSISLSGLYWAVGGRRGEVRVWREAGQVLHRVWQAHTDIVTALAFNSNERMVASGSWDGSVKLWDLESCALLWSGWHTNHVNSVAFSPDGLLLATAGNDATARIWDLQSGIQLQTLLHPGPVLGLAWHPNGRSLATGDVEGTIRLWEMQKNGLAACMQELKGHSNWVSGLAFAPDGNQLASGGGDGIVSLWDLISGHCERTFEGHTGRVHCVAWSMDGATLASGSFDHTIRVWNVHEGRFRMALHGHSAMVEGLVFTPDSLSLLSGGDDGTLRLWDVERGQVLRIQQGYTASLLDVAWSPDGSQIASAGSGTMVTLWNVKDGSLSEVLHGHRWVVVGVGWSPDGSVLASSGWDNAVRLWNSITGECLHILSDPDSADTIFFSLAWSPDGRFLACGIFLQSVLVWDVAARCPRWVNRSPATWVRCVAWSPDGTRIIGGGDDGHVYVWDAFNGTLHLRLAGHSSAVKSVVWSPDGSRFASGSGSSERGEGYVWNAQTGERLFVLAEHPGVVPAVAWMPDGEELISGSSDGRLRWWDADEGQCIRVQEAHQGTVQALKVSPDGSQLASCGDDGVIALWDLPGGKHMRTLRRDRPYERLNITGTRGLSEAQKESLHVLGAFEETPG